MSCEFQVASFGKTYTVGGIIVHCTSCLRCARESLQILQAAVELCPNHFHHRPCTDQRLLQPCALQQAEKTVQWVAYPVEIQIERLL